MRWKWGIGVLVALHLARPGATVASERATGQVSESAGVVNASTVNAHDGLEGAVASLVTAAETSLAGSESGSGSESDAGSETRTESETESAHELRIKLDLPPLMSPSSPSSLPSPSPSSLSVSDQVTSTQPPSLSSAQPPDTPSVHQLLKQKQQDAHISDSADHTLADADHKEKDSQMGRVGTLVDVVAKAVAAIVDGVEDVIIPRHKDHKDHNKDHKDLRSHTSVPDQSVSDSDSTSSTMPSLHTPTSSSLDASATVSTTASIASGSTHDMHDDDGADVKVIENIMARTLENAIGDAANALDKEETLISMNTTAASPVATNATVHSGTNGNDTIDVDTAATAVENAIDWVYLDILAPDQQADEIEPEGGNMSGTTNTTSSTSTNSNKHLFVVHGAYPAFMDHMGVANATDDAFTSNATNSTANSIPPQKETATERAISLPPDSIPDSKESNPTNSTNGTSLNENGRDIPSIDRFPDSHVPAPNKQSQPPTPPVTTAVKTPPTPATSQASNPAIASAAPLSPPAPVRDVTSRSKKPKDDRFNHASIDCGALILANNKEASGTTSILVKSKDQYMLNRCKNVAGGGPGKEGKGGGANFVVVELCNTIKIDTLVMGNLEYFSSTFKEFGVYVAEQYPPKADGPHGGWKHLGTFHGANQRDFQYFKIKDPLIFTRYVKVEFLSYHGSEYYCPITQLRVHGKTEMDEFRDEEESLAAEVTRQDAAAQEAIRNIALQAVKSIDQVADAVGVVGGAGIMFGGVVGEIGSAAAAAAATAAATTGEPVPPTSTSSAAGTPNSASSPAAAVAPPPEPSMSPLEDPNSYILSADYFRLFMENQDPTLQTLHLSDASSPAAPHGEQSTAVGESTVPATQQGAAGSGGGGSTSQESIFKTISKRLTLLERNATLSYKFIEEQSRAYHSAFVRVEIARADSIRKALGECNRTMTRVVRDLAKDYEAAWGLLLRDLERQRRVSDSRIKEVERNLDKLSERMTRQIFYEFILVILLVLILTRIFTPNPATGGAALESFTPMGSPRGGLRKRFSPYFMRYMHTPHAAAAKSREAGGIAGGAAVSADAVGDTLRRGSGTTRPRIPSSLAGTVEEFEEEEEEEGEYVPDAGTESGSEEESSEGEEEEEEEGSDVDYFSVGESNRVGDEDTPALTAGEGGVEVVEVVGTPDVPMPSASGMGKGKQLESPQGHVHGPKSASKQRQNGTGTRGGSTDHSQTYGQLSQRNNKSRVKIMVNASGGGSGPSSAHSEPSTPSMNSAARFEASGAETVSGLLSPTGLNSAASKKKRKRRRSLAGLRLQSQSEVVDGNSNGVVPK